MKRRNGGFTIMELIVAIGILGSLTVMTAGLMDTSSGTYRNIGTESQLQSEAQLVANAISEVIIDGKKVAKFTDTAAVVDGAGSFDNSNAGNDGVGAFIPVWIDDNTIRIIARDTAKDEVYMFDCPAVEDADGNVNVTAPTEVSLLGQHVTALSVNLARAAGPRIIDYSMTYEKGGKSYKGDYQIFMRNGGSAATVSANEAVDEAKLINATVSPKIVYIDVYDKKLKGTYYKESLLTAPSTFVGDPSIDLTATVLQQGFGIAGDMLHEYNLNWSLGGGAPAAVTMTGDNTAAMKLQFDNTTFDYSNDLTAYQFQVDFEAEGITKEAGTDAAGNPVYTTTDTQVKSDYTTIYFRLCRKVDVTPVVSANISEWDEARFVGSGMYASGASKVNGINYYARPDSTITITGVCDSPNVATDQPTWKLEYRLRTETDAAYRAVPASVARLANTATAANSNSIRIGSSATNDMVFRVTCTSTFDDTISGKYEFGIQPSMNAGDTGGFFSRGYYTDMNQLFKDNWTQYTSPDGHELFKTQGGNPQIESLVYLKCEGIYDKLSGHGTPDMVKITYDTDGTPRMYIDYQAFQFSGQAKNDFYKWGCQLKFYYGYKDTSGNYYLNTTDPTIVADMRSHLPSDNRSAAIGVAGGECVYNLGGVSVSKITPASGFILLNKGETQNVGIKTNYYNIMRPDGGNYYLGAYLGDMTTNDKSNNLIQPGKGETDAYCTVEMISDYGDVNKYVENAYISLGAKNTNAQKNFLTKPMTLRLTANDFYTISMSEEASWSDYTLLISNLMGSDEKTTDAEVYFPVPDYDAAGNSASFSVNGVNMQFPKKNNVSTNPAGGTEITGINKSGTSIKGKCYYNGNRLYLEYNAKKYVYDSVYKCWKRA